MEQPLFCTTQALAKRLGVRPQTIRRWEREGVIPVVARRRGQRVYTPADVERIEAAVIRCPPVQKEA
jgi:DNA-binding transcriptional MerR regulator